MMVFICNFCGKDYKVDVHSNQQWIPPQQTNDPHYPMVAGHNIQSVNLTYQYPVTTTDSRGNPHSPRTVTLTDPHAPCEECKDAAEQARKEKLEEIRKAAGRVEPD